MEDHLGIKENMKIVMAPPLLDSGPPMAASYFRGGGGFPRCYPLLNQHAMFYIFWYIPRSLLVILQRLIWIKLLSNHDDRDSILHLYLNIFLHICLPCSIEECIQRKFSQEFLSYSSFLITAIFRPPLSMISHDKTSPIFRLRAFTISVGMLVLRYFPA